MITSGKIFGEAKRRWVPTQEVNASHTGGTTSGLCPSGALSPPHASAIRAASCSSAVARSSNLVNHESVHLSWGPLHYRGTLRGIQCR
jgi:hypothetical protein